MYGVNASIPKTLVRYLVSYFKDNTTRNKNKVLTDILDTPISPELLPPDDKDNITQMTESKIGPYVLHDFFLYHFLRYGADPEKLFLLAEQTFKDNYSKEELIKWLTVFINRFFTQQFKRSCMPDGPKVGTISLSPRGDLRMPSDIDKEIWIRKIKEM
jgi:NAD+ synthase (glutamine-hydrolysing)